MKDLLKELVETPGPSGKESKVRELIKGKVEDHADSMETDDLGNLIVRKGEGDKTLMIAAHMDQIGMTVKRIDDEGFIRFSKVGGLYPRNLMDQRVTVHTDHDDLTGVTGAKPIHLTDKEERDKVPEMKDMFIDVGAEDKEDAEEMGVNVGDYITYDRGLTELGNDLVTSPALDNRMGCALAIEALKRFDESYELAVVFTVQEEVGLKGAKTAAYGVDPDVALAVDTSMAGGTPQVTDDECKDQIGDGIGIDMVQSGGRGLIAPENIRKWLIDTAEDNDHNYYRALYDGGATDAANIYMVKEGIPTGSLGVPTRNLHTPTEVVSLSDMEEAVDFIEDAFKTLEDHF